MTDTIQPSPQPAEDLERVLAEFREMAIAASETLCDTDHEQGLSVHAIATQAVTPGALIALTRHTSATFTDFIPTCELWRRLDPSTVLTLLAARARERELREALERLYLETDRPYAVYGDPAISTMEQLVCFENARIEAARVIGLERIKALLAQSAAEERERG